MKSGVKIDGNQLRFYVGKGNIHEYLVWLLLLVQGGGLTARGVANTTKSAKGLKIHDYSTPVIMQVVLVINFFSMLTIVSVAQCY